MGFHLPLAGCPQGTSLPAFSELIKEKLPQQDRLTYIKA